MSAEYHGITTAAITWAQTESEIDRSETGEATISCVGHVAAEDTPTALETAEDLIPAQIPISNAGPIGNSSKYIGARYASHSLRYSDESTIRIDVKYKIALAPITPNPDGGDTSDNDRASRSIAVVSAPILTNPVVSAFPAKEVQRLRALIQGETFANPEYDPAGTSDQQRRFLKRNEDNTLSEVVFSETSYEVDGIEASPLDYAKMIAGGNETYSRPAVRHTVSKTREFPATNAEYSKVGEVTSAPQLAPSLSGGQWFLNGITDNTENGNTWNTSYEWEYSAFGGVLKYLYKGGTGELT